MAGQTRHREHLLDATERELSRIKAAVERKRAPLRGAAAIGREVGAVIDRHKMAKHFDVRITDDALSWRRHNAGIAAEARLDGLYIIRTSVPAAAMTAEQAVGAYKALARVERTFRSLKTVDLEIRPVYHRLAPRVRAHVFLCMLALLCGVPHAPAPGATAVRRARPCGGRGGADVDRGDG